MAHRYRGKHPNRKIWLGLALALVVVALAVVLAVFVLPEYLVQTEDGSFSLDLPFLRDWFSSPAPSGTSAPPEESINVIVVTPTPEVTPTSEPEPSPTAAQISAPFGLFIPQSAAADAAKLQGFKALAESSELNMLVLDVKSDEGVMLSEEVMSAAIEALKSPGVTVVGRLSCFGDNTLTRQNSAVGVKHTSGVNWLDANMLRWLNPYKPEVISYINDCIAKAESAGFDALLLDNVSFPYNGRLNVINYGADGRVSHSAALGLFLDTLGAYTVPLYGVALPQTLSGGVSAESGQDYSKFNTVFEKLFVAIPAETAMESWSAAVQSGRAPDTLVPILRVPEASAGGATQEESLRALMGVAGGSDGYGYFVTEEKGEYPYGAFE